MSKRKNDTFGQVVVGAFMVTVLLLLGYFTIVVSGVDVVFGRERVMIRVAFDQVGGLKDHDNVMYRGTKVGVVDHVSVTPSNLVATARIDGAVVVREGYRIAVHSLSMLGGNYMVIEEGKGRPLDLAATLFHGETPTDWMQDVSRIASSLKDFMDRPELSEIVTNVAAASARVRAITERTDAIVTRVDGGEGVLGKLLEPKSQLSADLEQTVANANAITDRINRGKGLAGRLIADDDRVYEDLKAGVAAFRKAAESFDMGEVKGDVKSLVASANDLIRNLTEVSARLKNGEGTLGKLANDPEMYNEVNSLIRDVRQVIDNYRDTTPITTFTSLATGAL